MSEITSDIKVTFSAIADADDPSNMIILIPKKAFYISAEDSRLYYLRPVGTPAPEAAQERKTL